MEREVLVYADLVAAELDLTQAEIERMASAFEHEALKEALATEAKARRE